MKTIISILYHILCILGHVIALPLTLSLLFLLFYSCYDNKWLTVVVILVAVLRIAYGIKTKPVRRINYSMKTKTRLSVLNVAIVIVTICFTLCVYGNRPSPAELTEKVDGWYTSLDKRYGGVPSEYKRILKASRALPTSALEALDTCFETMDYISELANELNDKRDLPEDQLKHYVELKRNEIDKIIDSNIADITAIKTRSVIVGILALLFSILKHLRNEIKIAARRGSSRGGNVNYADIFVQNRFT